MNPSPARIAARVLEALEKGERIYTAVVTDSADASLIGRRWWCSGRRHGGTLGSPSLDAEVAAALPALFPPRESRGALSRDFEYRDGGRADNARVYIELHGPRQDGDRGRGAHRHSPGPARDMLGLRVEVLDDRTDFAAPERFPEASAVRVIDFRDPFADTPLAPHDHVVLVTRGHSFDYECLVRLLRMAHPPHYIGMIGSRRRVRATHEQLVRDGFTTEEMGRVRAPVGWIWAVRRRSRSRFRWLLRSLCFTPVVSGVPLSRRSGSWSASSGTGARHLVTLNADYGIAVRG